MCVIPQQSIWRQSDEISCSIKRRLWTELQLQFKANHEWMPNDAFVLFGIPGSNLLFQEHFQESTLSSLLPFFFIASISLWSVFSRLSSYFLSMLLSSELIRWSICPWSLTSFLFRFRIFLACRWLLASFSVELSYFKGLLLFGVFLVDGDWLIGVFLPAGCLLTVKHLGHIFFFWSMR